MHAYARPVDMRKSFDTLAVLVKRELGRDILSGDVYVFVGKTRRRAKVALLGWHGTLLVREAVGEGPFRRAVGGRRDGALRWTMSELSLFLEGSELVGRIRLSPEPWLPGAVHAA